jgi:hypothetical protein
VTSELEHGRHAGATYDLVTDIEQALDGTIRDRTRTVDAYAAAEQWLWGGYLPREGTAASVVRGVTSFDAAGTLGGFMGRLLRAFGRAGEAREVFLLGCQHQADRVLMRDVIAHLQAGAIVLSSDRSAGLPLWRDLLSSAAPAPPRRARVGLRVPAVGRSLPLLPAIRLAPGHRPLTSSAGRGAGAHLLAADALTGDPLGVAMPVLRGWIVHSSAHWWQDVSADDTETGSRILLTTPAYRSIGHAFPLVTVGEFHAAAGMLAMLASGLAIACGLDAAHLAECFSRTEAYVDGLDSDVETA